MTDLDQNIEMWKIKKLIKSLGAARGNGTSMISLIVPVSFTYRLPGVLLTDCHAPAVLK